MPCFLGLSGQRLGPGEWPWRREEVRRGVSGFLRLGEFGSSSSAGSEMVQVDGRRYV